MFGETMYLVFRVLFEQRIQQFRKFEKFQRSEFELILNFKFLIMKFLIAILQLVLSNQVLVKLLILIIIIYTGIYLIYLLHTVLNYIIVLLVCQIIIQKRISMVLLPAETLIMKSLVHTNLLIRRYRIIFRTKLNFIMIVSQKG